MAQLCVTLWFSLTWLAGWNGWTRIFQMYLQLNMGKFQPAMLVYQRVINFKMEVDGSWKMIFLSNWVIFRVLAINFQECMKKTLVRFEKNHRIRRPTALVISATGFRTYMFPNTCTYIYLGSTPHLATVAIKVYWRFPTKKCNNPGFDCSWKGWHMVSYLYRTSLVSSI